MSIDYSETFESRIDDIRRDGPNIYTSCLEITDNSIGWGSSSEILISFDNDRMILKIKDNGPKGFGSEESIYRYFKLGEKNDKITTKTIGKYGKGGYKAVINIGNDVFIQSYFDDKEYSIGTDFITMIRENTFNPIQKLKHSENKEKHIGSEIEVKVRPEYHKKFDTLILERHLIRAYHLNKTIQFNVNHKIITPCNSCPYTDILKKELIHLYYDTDKNIFISKDYMNENDEDDEDDEDDKKEEKYVGKITLYVLKGIITQNALLGDLPGLDIYRNNRMCNTQNPLRNIGHIGDNLSRGQMRGMRCHMIFEYTNIQLTDKLDMDDCLGLTTNKEICEDEDKFDKSFRTILETSAKRCNTTYEKLWDDKKNNHIKNIKNIFDILNHLTQLDDIQLCSNKMNIKEIKDNYESFKKIKTWKVEEDTMGYYYYKNKKEADIDYKKKEAERQKKNWPAFQTIDRIIELCDLILQRKNNYHKIEKEIKKKMKETKFDYDLCQKIIHTEKHIVEFLNSALESDNKKEYYNALSDYKNIIEIIQEAKLETYFNELFCEAKNKIIELELKETERIRHEEEKKMKEAQLKKEREEKLKQAAQQKKEREEKEKEKEKEEKLKQSTQQQKEMKKLFMNFDHQSSNRNNRRKPDQNDFIPAQKKHFQTREELIQFYYWLKDELTEEEKKKRIGNDSR